MSVPYIRFNDPLFPWYWRITQGFANLADGIVTVLTLGLVCPAFGQRCARDCLKWGLQRTDG